MWVTPTKYWHHPRMTKPSRWRGFGIAPMMKANRWCGFVMALQAHAVCDPTIDEIAEDTLAAGLPEAHEARLLVLPGPFVANRPKCRVCRRVIRSISDIAYCAVCQFPVHNTVCGERCGHCGQYVGDCCSHRHRCPHPGWGAQDARRWNLPEVMAVNIVPWRLVPQKGVIEIPRAVAAPRQATSCLHPRSSSRSSSPSCQSANHPTLHHNKPPPHHPIHHRHSIHPHHSRPHNHYHMSLNPPTRHHHSIHIITTIIIIILPIICTSSASH